MKFEFSGRIFEKYSNMIFHQNPPCWSQDVSMRTNGQTWRS